MTEAAATAPGATAGTVWKRAIALFVVCMIAVGVLAIGLILGVIPIQLALSKNPFQVTLGTVHAKELDAYVGTAPNVDGGQLAGMNLKLAGGEVDDLCLSTVLDLPFIDKLAIEITSGQNDSIPLQKVEAHAVSMDIGKATAKNVALGESSESGPAGNFGVMVGDADDVANVWADGRSIKVLSVQLRGLGLKLKTGEHNCPRPE